ncbi:hypothetical protein [Halocatena salina]|uniref:Uncharacterized protein n=1 Tax=Halocatena salina TaxID=2934340 RepID=A0A8U0A3M5_9EURY|nr:hypothetical protein [Halocatena salina]UPM43634.1 hypothetical protein MW046_04090 [Halocatena salina]
MPPRPVTEWPDRPVTRSEIQTDLDPIDAIDPLPLDDTVVGVWGVTQGQIQRRSIPEEVPEAAIVDFVLETPTEYRMYSYVQHDRTTQWVTYEAEEKRTEGGDKFETTLQEYTLLAGDTDISRVE